MGARGVPAGRKTSGSGRASATRLIRTQRLLSSSTDGATAPRYSVYLLTGTKVQILTQLRQGGLTSNAPRVRNPDAVVLAMLLLKLVHRDTRLHAARAMLSLARASARNCRVLTEAGFLSLLLTQYSSTLFGNDKDDMLRPVLCEFLVHFARQGLSVKDTYSLLQRLTPPSCTTVQLVQALDMLQQAVGASNTSSSPIWTSHAYFEAPINIPDQEDSGPSNKCPGMLDVRGLDVAWPPSHGLSFCCWLRVDSMLKNEGLVSMSSNQTSSTKPAALIFSLRHQEQEAVVLQVVLTNGVLSVEAPGRLLATFGHTFEFGELYHVAVVYSRHLLGSDSVTLYVNGAQISSETQLEDGHESKGRFNMKGKDVLERIEKAGRKPKSQRFSLLIGGDKPSTATAVGWTPPALLRVGTCCIVEEALPARYVRGLFMVGCQRCPQIGSELGPMIPRDMVSHDVLTTFEKAEGFARIGSSSAAAQSMLQLSTGTVSLSTVKFSCCATSVCAYRQVLTCNAAAVPMCLILAPNVCSLHSY